MCFWKKIYQVDLQPFEDLQGLLYNATNNINQIAKRVNSTGIIYSDNINDMKKKIDHILKEILKIHSLLFERNAETSDGNNKNSPYKIHTQIGNWLYSQCRKDR